MFDRYYSPVTFMKSWVNLAPLGKFLSIHQKRISVPSHFKNMLELVSSRACKKGIKQNSKTR